jgi:hypothetical protein
MGSIFGGPKMPAPPEPVAPPTREDPAVTEAARRQRNAAALARGRGATILTSELGVGSGSATGRPRTLGGM